MSAIQSNPEDICLLRGLEWVTGGKTPSEYMLSELPQLTDIVRRVRRYSASPLVLRITAFWVQSQAGFWPNTKFARGDGDQHICRFNADADNPSQQPNHGVRPALRLFF